MAELPTDTPSIFRPVKRRKVFRQRERSTSPPRDETPSGPTSSADHPATDSVASPPLSVADLVRQRRAFLRKRGGIGFSAAREDGQHDEDGAEEERQIQSKLDEVVMTFAPQTGQVADVDQHMIAYIDAEIARRFRPPSPKQHAAAPTLAEQSSNSARQDLSLHRQPAALGRIMEVDLGPDVSAKNVAATELARAVRDGLASEEPEPDTRKAGRKGKWRRRRRNSEDLRRDRIVEEVLKESRLAVNDEPAAVLSNDPGSEEEDVEAADERVAEQFRREFLDAQQARRKRQPASNAPPKAKEEAKDTKSRGPKLGGSRSARAAMREKSLAEKKGPGGR